VSALFVTISMNSYLINSVSMISLFS